MLSLTTTTLANHTLLLASRVNEHQGEPTLVFVDWLNTNALNGNELYDNELYGNELNGNELNNSGLNSTQLHTDQWQHSKSIMAIKKQYQLADEDVRLIDKNSLSKQSPAESLLLTAIHQLNQYQAGTRTEFELPLDMSIGTPFQQSVWQALQQIPYGETISYAQLAQNIGKPTAFRAVANANGRNPFSIIVPCHRVIASDGGLGGYTGGLDKKQLLLQLEQK